MDDSDDLETSFKHGLERTRELQRLHKEQVWRSFADEQVGLVEDQAGKALLNDLDVWIKKGIDTMDSIASFIHADTDKAQAERLCRSILPQADKMASNILHAIVARIKSDPRYQLTVPPPDVIILDSDEEEMDSVGEVNPSDTVALNSRFNESSAAAQGPHNPPRDKRVHDDILNAQVAGPSRSSKRTRHRSRPHYPYDVPSSPPPPAGQEEPQLSTRIRTIPANDVEGTDFIFRYPLVGDGYYVVRCDRYETSLGGITHQFREDPFEYKRAVRHFSLDTPRPKCHLAKDREFCTEEEVVRKFGYRVVDNEGNNVASEWVAQSNARVTSIRNKEKAKKAAAKGKQQPPSWNIQYGDARRGNTLARPSKRTAVPVADVAMETSRTPQEPAPGDAGRQEDADHILMNPVVSDILSTSEQAARAWEQRSMGF